MISISGGSWEGEQGFALGVSGVTDNSRLIYKASGTTTSQGNFGGGISLGWQWK